jgi:hypothetical protein
MLATVQHRPFCVPHLLSKNVKIRIYKTIILPVVFFVCEIYSPTLREEHRLRVMEDRVLRRMFRL